MVAELPLICQPGAEWNYSRSTDILGRIIEVDQRQVARRLPHRAHPCAAADGRDRLLHRQENAGRLAEAFPTDPWSGDPVQLFNMLEQPAMESGGGGLVSTTMDYARFAQMLLNGGTLDGNRIIGRKTLELMASDHLTPQVKIKGDARAARPWFRSRLRRSHARPASRRSQARSASSSGAAWPAPSSGSIRRRICSPCS